MKIVIDPGAKIPEKAHKNDAGFDIFSRENKVVEARGSAIFDTGVHVQIPSGMVGMLKSKSGLNVKYGILGEGVIDSGYTGSIRVKLYNNSDSDYHVNSGDKISQLVILPLADVGDIEIVESLEDTERGENGFGSSGK